MAFSLSCCYVSLDWITFLPFFHEHSLVDIGFKPQSHFNGWKFELVVYLAYKWNFEKIKLLGWEEQAERNYSSCHER